MYRCEGGKHQEQAMVVSVELNSTEDKKSRRGTSIKDCRQCGVRSYEICPMINKMIVGECGLWMFGQSKLKFREIFLDGKSVCDLMSTRCFSGMTN